MSRLAEREGFEPPVPFGITGFQDQRLQPLGHRSIANQLDYVNMLSPVRQAFFRRPGLSGPGLLAAYSASFISIGFP